MMFSHKLVFPLLFSLSLATITTTTTTTVTTTTAATTTTTPVQSKEEKLQISIIECIQKNPHSVSNDRETSNALKYFSKHPEESNNFNDRFLFFTLDFAVLYNRQDFTVLIDMLMQMFKMISESYMIPAKNGSLKPPVIYYFAAMAQLSSAIHFLDSTEDSGCKEVLKILVTSRTTLLSIGDYNGHLHRVKVLFDKLWNVDAAHDFKELWVEVDEILLSTYCPSLNINTTIRSCLKYVLTEKAVARLTVDQASYYAYDDVDFHNWLLEVFMNFDPTRPARSLLICGEVLKYGSPAAIQIASLHFSEKVWKLTLADYATRHSSLDVFNKVRMSKLLTFYFLSNYFDNFKKEDEGDESWLYESSRVFCDLKIFDASKFVNLDSIFIQNPAARIILDSLLGPKLMEDENFRTFIRTLSILDIQQLRVIAEMIADEGSGSPEYGQPVTAKFLENLRIYLNNFLKNGKVAPLMKNSDLARYCSLASTSNFLLNEYIQFPKAFISFMSSVYQALDPVVISRDIVSGVDEIRMGKFSEAKRKMPGWYLKLSSDAEPTKAFFESYVEVCAAWIHILKRHHVFNLHTNHFNSVIAISNNFMGKECTKQYFTILEKFQNLAQSSNPIIGQLEFFTTLMSTHMQLGNNSAVFRELVVFYYGTIKTMAPLDAVYDLISYLGLDSATFRTDIEEHHNIKPGICPLDTFTQISKYLLSAQHSRNRSSIAKVALIYASVIEHDDQTCQMVRAVLFQFLVNSGVTQCENGVGYLLSRFIEKLIISLWKRNRVAALEDILDLFFTSSEVVLAFNRLPTETLTKISEHPALHKVAFASRLKPFSTNIPAHLSRDEFSHVLKVVISANLICPDVKVFRKFLHLAVFNARELKEENQLFAELKVSKYSLRFGCIYGLGLCINKSTEFEAELKQISESKQMYLRKLDIRLENMLLSLLIDQFLHFSKNPDVLLDPSRLPESMRFKPLDSPKKDLPKSDPTLLSAPSNDSAKPFNRVLLPLHFQDPAKLAGKKRLVFKNMFRLLDFSDDNSDDQKLKKLSDAIKDMKVDPLGMSHCRLDDAEPEDLDALLEKIEGPKQAKPVAKTPNKKNIKVQESIKTKGSSTEKPQPKNGKTNETSKTKANERSVLIEKIPIIPKPESQEKTPKRKLLELFDFNEYGYATPKKDLSSEEKNRIYVAESIPFAPSPQLLNDLKKQKKGIATLLDFWKPEQFVMKISELRTKSTKQKIPQIAKVLEEIKKDRPEVMGRLWSLLKYSSSDPEAFQEMEINIQGSEVVMVKAGVLLVGTNFTPESLKNAIIAKYSFGQKPVIKAEPKPLAAVEAREIKPKILESTKEIEKINITSPRNDGAVKIATLDLVRPSRTIKKKPAVVSAEKKTAVEANADNSSKLVPPPKNKKLVEMMVETPIDDSNSASSVEKLDMKESSEAPSTGPMEDSAPTIATVLPDLPTPSTSVLSSYKVIDIKVPQSCQKKRQRGIFPETMASINFQGLLDIEAEFIAFDFELTGLSDGPDVVLAGLDDKIRGVKVHSIVQVGLMPMRKVSEVGGKIQVEQAGPLYRIPVSALTDPREVKWQEASKEFLIKNNFSIEEWQRTAIPLQALEPIWKLMQKKTLIVHNGLIDMLHLLKALNIDLTCTSYQELNQLFESNNIRFYDSRVLILRKFPYIQKNLEGLSSEFLKIDSADKGNHDAAFDAFCTGMLVHKFGPLFETELNGLYKTRDMEKEEEEIREELACSSSCMSPESPSFVPLPHTYSVPPQPFPIYSHHQRFVLMPPPSFTTDSNSSNYYQQAIQAPHIDYQYQNNVFPSNNPNYNNLTFNNYQYQ